MTEERLPETPEPDVAGEEPEPEEDAAPEAPAETTEDA